MRGDRPEGRLLHPRRRQPDRRAAGGADPHPAPAGVGRRRLPAPDSCGRSRPGWTRWARPGPCAATSTPTPRRAALAQALLMVPMLALVGLRWSSVAAAISTVAAVAVPWAHPAWMPTAPWWSLALAWLVLFSPAGRIAIAAGGARLLLRGVRPGSYPRGGSVHVRLWAADPARRAVRRDGRLRRVVDHPLRPRARREDRQRRRPALRTARDRPAQDRARRGRGAGGGPGRLLGRRRRRAHRQDPHRRRGHDRLAQHAAAGRADRQGLRDRGRVHGRRRSSRRSALGGLARAAGRQVRRVLAVDPPVALALLGSSPTASRRCSSGCCPRWRRCLRSRSSRSASQARRPPRTRRAGRC